MSAWEEIEVPQIRSSKASLKRHLYYSILAFFEHDSIRRLKQYLFSFAHCYSLLETVTQMHRCSRRCLHLSGVFVPPTALAALQCFRGYQATVLSPELCQHSAAKSNINDYAILMSYFSCYANSLVYFLAKMILLDHC